MTSRVINLELFPCSGGMAEGFRRAGITFDMSFDWSKDACDSYESNLGHRPVQIDVRDLVRMALFGDLLPWVTCRDALAHLEGDDLGRPVRLRYRHSPGAGTKPRASSLDEPAQTVRAKATSDLALVTPERIKKRPRRRSPDEANMSSPSEIDKPSRTIRAAPRGAQTMSTLTIAEGTERFRNPSKQDAPARTVTSDGTSGNRLLEWPWDRPSTTVTTRAAVPPPGHHPESGSILTMPDAVVLSERAAKLLQGFPETWIFAGATKKARWDQIGMAMPPGLAAAVGREVRRALGKEEDMVDPKKFQAEAKASVGGAKS